MDPLFYEPAVKQAKTDISKPAAPPGGAAGSSGGGGGSLAEKLARIAYDQTKSERTFGEGKTEFKPAGRSADEFGEMPTKWKPNIGDQQVGKKKGNRWT